MALTGHNRIRSTARRSATPILLASGGLAGYAVWIGEVPWLRIAVAVSVAAGLLAVVLFDVELVRERRDHAAERAVQAKAYIDLYARRLGAHMQEAAGAQAEVSITGSAPPFAPTEAVAASVQAWERQQEPLAESATRPAAVVDPTDRQPAQDTTERSTGEADAEVALEPPRVLPSVDGGEQAPELWQDQDEAPTVVDLIAYEMRARLAQEEGRERDGLEEETRAAASG